MSKKHNKHKSKSGSVVETTRALSVSSSLRGITGRATIDSVQDVFRSSMRILTPFAGDDYWRNYGLDQRTLDRVPVWKLVELLIDLSPDVSKGLWDWQRLFNPGYECTAYKANSKEDVKDEAAQEAVNAFLSQLHGPYSVTNQVPANVVINTISMQAFLRGGMFAELILDKRGRMPLEIVTPDPQTIRFERIDDPERGKVWQLGQFQGALGTGMITPLDRPTIVYLPVDPIPGKPFGRPLIHPAIFATLFLIGLLHDLRRVVAQQGYPRLDLVIDTEKLMKMMPASLQGDPAKMKEWVDGTVAEISAAYGKLQPDDAYVHPDVVTVNLPEGAGSGGNLTGLTGLDGVIKSLESMLTKALKTMPLMMGAAGSETNQNRQWEVQAAGIKAVQHLAENLLEKLLTIALQVQGISARVVFRFSELRAAEMLRDAQVERFTIENAWQLYLHGIISQDEQAQRTTGKATADQQEPRQALTASSGSSGVGGIAGLNADPGSQRLKTNDPQTRNAVASALLLMSNQHPTEDEIDEAIIFFNASIPIATGILEPEIVQ